MNWIFYIFLAFSVFSLITTAIAAYRYRQYLQTGWYVLKTYRQMKQKSPAKQKNIETKTTSNDSPLVRCSKCGDWTAQDDAVRLKSSYYCSHRCMEESFQMSN